MATLYLHIGTPKTGTSALQSFLFSNQEALEKHNICYPNLGFQYAGVLPKHNAHFLIHEKYCEKKDAESRPEELSDYSRGLAMLGDLARSYNSIILSDEAIYHRSRRDLGNFYSSLKADLEAMGIDLRVVIYLRRQDLFVQSHWAQKIRVGAKYDFHQFLKQRAAQEYPLDYLNYLDSIAAVLGREALIVRPYEYSQFQGTEHTIQSDFLSILGLTLSDGFNAESEVRNTRLDDAQLQVQYVINIFSGMQCPDSDRPNKCNQIRGHYFRPGEQAQFLGQYTASNSALAREYLGRDDGQLFYDEMEECSQYTVNQNDLPSDIAIVYGRAICELEQANRRLEKELSQLRAETKSRSLSCFIKKIRNKIKSFIRRK